MGQTVLMTKEQTAVFLNTSVRTVERRIKEGHLTGVKVGSVVRLSADQVADYLAKSAKSSTHAKESTVHDRS